VTRGTSDCKNNLLQQLLIMNMIRVGLHDKIYLNTILKKPKSKKWKMLLQERVAVEKDVGSFSLGHSLT